MRNPFWTFFCSGGFLVFISYIEILIVKMKRIVGCIFLSCFCFMIAVCQPEDTVLTWKLAYPRIVTDGNNTLFEFQVQVKCKVPQTYLSSSDIRLSFNLQAFANNSGADLWAAMGEHYNTLNINGAPEYTLAKNIAGQGSNRRLAIGLVSQNSSGHPPGDDYFQEVLTTFHTMVIVRLKIIDPSLMAGIKFRQDVMNGLTAYKKTANSAAIYYDPHFYYPKDFKSTYMERVYCQDSGWTQIGNPGFGSWVDWSADVNTSVWDGNPSLDENPAYIKKLRIHPEAILTLHPQAGLVASDSSFLEDTTCFILQSSEGSAANFLDAGVKAPDTIPSPACYERSMSPGNHHHVSSPMINASYADLQQQPNGLNMFKEWKESEGLWEDLNDGDPPGSLLVPGRGYDVKYQVTGNRNFNGVPNSGEVVFPASFTPSAGQGWNLVGNPFPSSIAALRDGNNNDFFDFNPGLTGSLYFWDGVSITPSQRSDYTTFNMTGSTRANQNGPVFGQNISPCQGFMVKSMNAPCDIVFNNSIRIADDGQFFKSKGTIQSIWLSVISPEQDYNELLVGFLQGGTVGIDQYYDGYKLKGNPLLSFYSINDDKDFAIQGYPYLTDQDHYEIPLGIDAWVSGSYQFSLRDIENFPSSAGVFLEDKLTGITTDLLNNPAYSCSISNPGSYRDRFVLHIDGWVGTSPATSDQNEITQVFFDNEQLCVWFPEKSDPQKVICLDISGRIFLDFTSNQHRVRFHLPLNNQYIIVKAIDKKKITIKKVFIP